MVTRAIPDRANPSVSEIPVIGVDGFLQDSDRTTESIEVLLEQSIVAGVDDLRTSHDASSEAFRTAVMACEVASDTVAVSLGILISYAIYTGFEVGTHTHFRPVQIGFACFILSLCFVLMLYKDDAYNPADGLLRVKETERVLRASCTVSMLVLPVAFFAQLDRKSVE